MVKSGRVARPGGKGQREEWAVLFDGVKSKEQVRQLFVAGSKIYASRQAGRQLPRGQ